MYYQEKVINGVLHYRHSPDSKWKPLSDVALTAKISALRAELDNLRAKGERNSRIILGLKEALRHFKEEC